MSDTQTLAAVQEVLLSARIRFTTGTAAQWASANPILLKGEVGFVDNTIPVQFKVGDGTKTWSALGWGNATSLAQLAADANHRLVTDTQIAGWNRKADVFVFDHADYLSTTAATANAQKQVVKDIVAAANAGSNPVVFALNVKLPKSGRILILNGIAAVLTISSTQVVCSVADFETFQMAASQAPTITRAKLLFNSDGTVGVEPVDVLQVLTPNTVIDDLTHSGATGLPLSAAQGYALKQSIDNKQAPVYSLVKATTESGFASTYHLTKDGVKVGVSMNIPLDQVLRGSSIKSVTTDNAPYTGAKVGDKYIEFLFQNNTTPQYLPVQDLVDVYTGDGTYIQVSASNVVTLNYAALKTKLQSDLGSAFDAKGAGAAAAKAAIDDFKAGTFVIQCTIPGM